MYQLGHLFPNIEEFQLSVSFSFTSFYPHGDRRRITTTTSAPTPLPPYWTHLKRLRESSPEMHSLHLLESQVCESLVQLDLNFTHFSPLARDVLAKHSFKNAPHLESLTLWCVRLSYHHLDQLHEHCQYIKEITLFHPIFVKHPEAPYTGYFDPLPSIHYTPKPIDTMKHLKIINTIFEVSVPLLSYIAAKYKRLTTLAVTSKKRDKRSQAHALELCVEEMRSFMCDLVDMTPQLLQRFTVLELDNFEIVKNMNCKEMLSILAGRFRHTLKSLVIKSDIYTSSCSRYIAQLENLESLVMEPILSSYQDDEDDDEQDDDELENEEIELSVSLNILNHLPKLRHLSIEWFQLDDARIDTNIHLETLKLMDCTIQGNANQFFDHLLSSCLDLEKVTLFCFIDDHQREKKKKRKLRLCFKNHRLLEKIDVWIKGYPSLRYHEESEEKKKEWFDVERDGKFVTYYPSSKRKGTRYFVLECISSDLFYIPQRYNALYH
ncbi:hypothetical protein K501DRAFT_284398 [Backusella circina FSU 941]|nr:hypothetical protein K501DRAFT_284398 [Backusella circina FSU 941]